MTKARPWYENDKLWKRLQPVIFDNERIGVAAKDIEQILSLIRIDAGAPVLDLCCGIGRHSLELARRGFRVTAVDRTRAYLNCARKESVKEGLQIEFVQKDMRRFRRPGSFDCVVNLYTSFGYFENPRDDQRVLTNVYRSLRKGGTFVLEMMGKEIIARIFAEREWRRHDDVILLAERRVCDNWSRINNRWIVITQDSKDEFEFSHRIYSAVELCELFDKAGFRSVKVFGDFGGSPYDNKAQRLVVTGRK
jgi:SAM-dependent methyltransferase